jgi:hypothetical protein
MSGDEATKWNGYSVDEFREIFTDAKRIKKILIVPELKMLAGLSMPFPAFLVYSKLRKTSSIVSILGILYISSRYCFFTFSTMV